MLAIVGFCITIELSCLRMKTLKEDYTCGVYDSMSGKGAIVATFILLAITITPLSTSFPSGVEDIGDQGCLCHGESNQQTAISLSGLPEKFEANTTYNLTLTVANELIEENVGEPYGGFRMTVSQGTIVFENSNQTQYLDGGWTHTATGNKHREWKLTWNSPSDNTSKTVIDIKGNAVNGNGASSGDSWNNAIYTIPGVNNFDDISNQSSNHTMSKYDEAFLVFTLILLALLAVRILRD